MTITLYKTSDENSRVVKTLTDNISMTGNIVEETNVISPSILISNIENIASYNYCFITEFGRYYYIKEIISVRNGIWRLNLRVDVLMTYSDGIKNLNAIVMRQQNQVNLLLDDGYIPIQANQENSMISFPNSFTKNLNYILAVSGSWFYG